MSFVSELQRRNVFRVALAYLAAAWLIIQVAETTFPLFGLPDSAARLVIVVMAIGLVPALVFSWVFELTPDGLKRETDIDRSQSITAATGRSLDRIVIFILAIAVVYFAFDKFILGDLRVESARDEGRSQGLVASYGDKSIAVLPFVDMSPERDQEYMSDGVAEELLNLLTEIRQLRVISRSSAFAFKGKSISIPDIADQLNVSYILEGSVRKSGDRIRITSQLIEARSDTHLWSETYERKLDDIFAIQDDIAAAVVEELKVAILGERPKALPTSDEAYTRFLKARHFHERPSSESFRKALDLYKEALTFDPGYVPALVWLAALYDDMAYSLDISYEEVGGLAKEAIASALSVDPDSGMAHAMNAIITREWDGDLVLAASHMQRALELDPGNPIVLRWAGLFVAALGRYEDSVRIAEYLHERDPVGAISTFNLVVAYIDSGQFEKAFEPCEVLLTINPAHRSIRHLLSQAYLMTGNAEAALEQSEMLPDSDRRHMVSAMALHDLGREDEFAAAVAKLLESYGSGNLGISNRLATVYAYIGAADSAFEWLEQARIDETLVLTPNDIYMAKLQSDPRWEPFLNAAGKSSDFFDSIELKVSLPN